MVQYFIHDKHKGRTLLSFSCVCGVTWINVRREIFIHFMKTAETFAAKIPCLSFITDVESIVYVLVKELSKNHWSLWIAYKIAADKVECSICCRANVVLCFWKYTSVHLNCLTWQFRSAHNVLHVRWHFTGSIIVLSNLVCTCLCHLQSNLAQKGENLWY